MPNPFSFLGEPPRRATTFIVAVLLLASTAVTSRPTRAQDASDASRRSDPAERPGDRAVRPGDRIAVVGSGWVERMHPHPWLEMMLTLQVPGATFRNVGWSGDTVHGDARAVFGGRPDGYQRLRKDLEYAAPNLAILSYGENEAHGGESERSEFVAGYRKLVEDLQQADCRVVLIIPRAKENVGGGFPDPKAYNENLARLAEEIRKLARDRGCQVVDLERFAPGERFTGDGVTWNDAGYQAAAREIVRQLGFDPNILESTLEKHPHAVEELKPRIVKKNEWFFHRYRPQNETYLFLFRKHEQGNNAVEVERMERFVGEGERAIEKWLEDHALAPQTSP